MKVKDLIRHLSNVNENLEVLVDPTTFDASYVESVPEKVTGIRLEGRGPVKRQVVIES